MGAGPAKVLITIFSKRQFIYLKEELELVNCYVFFLYLVVYCQ